MIELLSPVGDFECLKAAVQNGANAVYFGAKSFGARAFASNFDDSCLNEAINYAKLRNVKTNLTLNTLIKEDEFENALLLANKAYEYGIDAIIVQDIGLANKLIKEFPDIAIHASTQMTVHNLEGVKLLKNLGFKRVVLSRELSLDEIKYICNNSDLEIEVFIHGALCISYSGQCLFSSMIGGRSGNRGKCAQTCRLPYELLKQENNDISKLNKGYLLSTRDLCSLELIPDLIKSGVTSFKIEGRMKSPEYVATVTRIYRKYIDLACNNSSQYKIDSNDKYELMQVFNRGNFSNGHLLSSSNHNLIFKEKQNNMGIYLGKIVKYNANKGLVTAKLDTNISIGDQITFEKENTKYTISELLQKNQNIKTASPMQIVTFGRMKGNINLGDKIYKISDKKLTQNAISSYSKEYIKNKIDCNIVIKKEQKINVSMSSKTFNCTINYVYDFIPEASKNSSITKEKIIFQFSKTQDTEFEFENFNIELDENIFIPVSILNDIRRLGINSLRNKIVNSFKRDSNYKVCSKKEEKNTICSDKKVSLLLNNLDIDLTKLELIDRLYVPLKYFGISDYSENLQYLSNKFNLYIYMPTIIRKNYTNTAKKILENSINNLKIAGIVISNMSQLNILPSCKNNLNIIGNYTLNLYNSFSADFFNNLKINEVTISPELDKDGILSLSKNSNVKKELIVYGNIPVMTMNYCPLGKTNKCYKECKKFCANYNSKYYLKDRLGLLFRVIPDNSQTITTIYNSKTMSIKYDDFDINSVRIDILDETIEQINLIISTVKNGDRFEGKDFTNGNLNRLDL